MKVKKKRMCGGDQKTRNEREKKRKRGREVRRKSDKDDKR